MCGNHSLNPSNSKRTTIYLLAVTGTSSSNALGLILMVFTSANTNI